MSSSAELPTWAPRVKKEMIRQLYADDAAGMVDAAQIDEVGFALLARCQSFIAANEAVEGRVYCPRCAALIQHSRAKEEILVCSCGWQLAWGDYFKTVQHMQLSGAEPVRAQFRAFVEAFPQARTSQEKIFLIDRLLHGFHWFFKDNSPTRPVAVNLIEGRLGDVIDFLETLTYGAHSTPGTQEHFAAWQSNLSASWLAAQRRLSQKKAGSEK